MPPQPLTKLERRILDYIIDYLRRNTYQPSIREIGKRFDIKSTKTVAEHLQSIADKGWIERDPSRSRGVRLLGIDLRPNVVTVPCYATGTANTGAAGDTSRFAGIAAETSYDLDRRLANGPDSFFLRVRGDELSAHGILDGDLVLVEAFGDEPVRDDDLVAVSTPNGFVLRRVGDLAPDQRPEGPAGSGAHSGGADILGRAVGVFRRFEGLLTGDGVREPTSRRVVHAAESRASGL